MLVKRISAKQARDNFSDLLGAVYFGKEEFLVEKKGRPYAFVINPTEYKIYQNYKQAAKKRFFEIVDEIQEANKDRKLNKVSSDITNIVEEVRQERYEKSK